MSKPIPKLMLSAYFDGEVSAEEQAAISRVAQTSPAAQQTLDDFAQLSENLKSLHQGVGSPGLREAVLAEIQPAALPQASSAPAWWQRHWQKVAGGVLAVTAAGLMLMVLPAGRQEENADQFAMNEAAPQGESVAMARREPSPGPADDGPGSHPLAPARITEGSASSDRENADGDLIRTAEIPEEWFTQQVAKDRRTPQPGDVMKYILREADETVVIPVTVVDVQHTAGRIRVLLTQHGIQSLPMQEVVAGGVMDESAVAILVESDWDRFPAVIEELDTAGFGVATFVQSSRAAQRAIVGQNSQSRLSKSSDLALRSDQSKPAPQAELRAENDSTARRSQEQTMADEAQIAQSAAPTGMFLEAPVTDEFVEQLGEQQQLADEEADLSAVAESAAARQPLTDDEASDLPTIPKRRFWEQPFATHGPARVVFLIKKSGSSP